MFLKTLVLVNWGNIPNGEFAMGPINLFSGANGSGKTTAADALCQITPRWTGPFRLVVKAAAGTSYYGIRVEA